MTKWTFAVAAWGAAIVGGVVFAAEDAPKYKIKDVMAKAMKGGLCGKVASGKASDDEKKTLAEMFAALAANKPPKGDADSWKSKTSALVEASKAAVEGKATAAAALKAAANCKACHDAHKPA